jgi:ribosome-associated protein
MRNAPPFPEASDDDDGRPSKSALKRQSHELQSLGEALVGLPASRTESLDLSESLRDALKEYHRTRSFEGKRRQMQYIGKLMRHVDPEPIREAVDAFKLGSAKDTLALHEAERWREELLASDDAVTRWMNAFPATDAQQLRSLARSARKDAKSEAPEARHARSYRELFQLIKAALADARTTDTPIEDSDDADD